MIRQVISNDLFTVTIVLGLLLITLTKVLFTKRFHDFILVLGNSKYLKIYAKDQKFFDPFDALLFLNFVLSIATLGFISYHELLDNVPLNIPLFIKAVIICAIFLVMKILLERLIGSIFDMDFIIEKYLFQKISYKNFLGLILIPINAVLIYGIPISPSIIYVIWTLIIVIFIIGTLTTIKTYQNLFKNNLFYFILYLCALEIAPYVILYQITINV